MDGDGPGQELQSTTLGTRSGPRATDGSDGDCAVWNSGTRVRVKVYHHSNRQVRRCLSTQVADGLHSPHGTVDQSHVHPQVGYQHDTSTVGQADDWIQS